MLTKVYIHLLLPAAPWSLVIVNLIILESNETFKNCGRTFFYWKNLLLPAGSANVIILNLIFFIWNFIKFHHSFVIKIVKKFTITSWVCERVVISNKFNRFMTKFSLNNNLNSRNKTLKFDTTNRIWKSGNIK